jgi:putative oxidoreductase
MLLNTFPNILTYSLIAPLILRVVLGFIAIDLGYLKLGKENTRWNALFETINFHPTALFVKALAIIEIIGGLMLLVGVFTQIVAIIFAVIYFCQAVLEYREETLEVRDLPFYVLMFTISLSLVFTGAGAFAFDIPML